MSDVVRISDYEPRRRPRAPFTLTEQQDPALVIILPMIRIETPHPRKPGAPPRERPFR